MAQTQTPTRFHKGSYQTIDHTPSSAVYAGDVVIDNGNVFIAVSAIAANALGALAAEGGRWIGPNGGHGFAVGDDIHWDADGNPVGGTAGTGAFSRVASGNSRAGKVTKAALSTDATVEFALHCHGDATS